MVGPEGRVRAGTINGTGAPVGSDIMATSVECEMHRSFSGAAADGDHFESEALVENGELEQDSQVLDGAAFALGLLMTLEEARGDVFAGIEKVFFSSRLSGLAPMLAARVSGGSSDALIEGLGGAGVSEGVAEIMARWALREEELATVELVGEKPPPFLMSQY